MLSQELRIFSTKVEFLGFIEQPVHVADVLDHLQSLAEIKVISLVNEFNQLGSDSKACHLSSVLVDVTLNAIYQWHGLALRSNTHRAKLLFVVLLRSAAKLAVLSIRLGILFYGSQPDGVEDRRELVNVV